MKHTWVKAILFIPVWFGSCVIAGIPMYIVFPEIFDRTPNQVGSNMFNLALSQVVFFVGTIVSFYFMREIVGKKNLNFPSIEFKGFLKGIMFAIILILIIFIFMLISKSVVFRFKGFNPKDLLVGLLLFVFVAINEELLFRGGILQLLTKSYSKYWALLISSLLFGMVHLFNDGVTLIGFLNIVLSGAIMGELYLKYNSIAPAISLHLLWNFLQGPVLGFAVSGHSTNSMFMIEEVENSMLSGGSFGIEGSVFTLAVQLTCILFLLFRGNKSSKIIINPN